MASPNSSEEPSVMALGPELEPSTLEEQNTTPDCAVCLQPCIHAVR